MKKPDWLKVRLQGGGVTAKVRKTLEDLQLNTVCTEANCPNKMECYERGTATFMILNEELHKELYNFVMFPKYA